MNEISIMGCGWLGLPLAEKLLSLKYQVRGSTTNLEKLKELENRGIIPHLICLQEDEVLFQPKENFSDFFKADVLVFNIPPKATLQDHFSQVKFLFSSLPRDLRPKKMIFVSSTSVYKNGVDEVKTYDENVLPKSDLEPDQAGGKVLLRVEQWLKSQMGSNLTVLRMGGLIGDGRYPSSFLFRKQKLIDPKNITEEMKNRLLQPTNFLHQSDAVSIIVSVIKNKWWGEIFNAVCSNHPPRWKFAKGEAKVQMEKLYRDDPDFFKKSVGGKKIINDKLKKKGYQFLVDDPLDMK